jgi:LysM repeat protein
MLTAINPQVRDPWRLPVGMWVRLPEKKVPQPGLSRIVRVQLGDSLWKLARAQLGSGEAWRCVARANPQLKDSNLIVPGEMLAIPQDCAISPRPKKTSLSAR